MKGFGIDVEGPQASIGDENDPRIVGHDVTNGDEEGGRTAMENLLQKDPDINVVYTINEPAAAGAYEALKAAGKEKDVLIVSVDGGCPGVKNVEAGVIGATSQQYPLLMASMGVEAIAEVRQDRQEAGADRRAWTSSTPASTLITDKPVDGVDVDRRRGRPEELLGLIAWPAADARRLRRQRAAARPPARRTLRAGAS